MKTVTLRWSKSFEMSCIISVLTGATVFVGLTAVRMGRLLRCLIREAWTHSPNTGHNCSVKYAGITPHFAENKTASTDHTKTVNPNNGHFEMPFCLSE